MSKSFDHPFWQKAQWMLLIFSIIVLGLVLRPFFTTSLIAGWDLLPHYYVLHSMVGLLQSGSIVGYDPNWLAGYPSFTFYQPMVYVLAALPTVASGGAIPSPLSFNYFIVLLPFAFLAALHWTTKTYLGERQAIASIFFGLIFLLGKSEHLLAPFGIYGSLTHGHVSSFFGTVLVVILFGLVEKCRRDESVLNLLLGTLLIFALILTHTLSAIFTLFLFAFYVAFHGRRSVAHLTIMGCSALALTAFWWLPFIQYLEFTSGTPVAQPWLDPLIAMLPDSMIIQSCIANPSWGMLLRLPFPAIALLLCTLASIVSLVRRGDLFLPVTFLSLLLLLPRNVFSALTPAPIHYYRFVMPLFAIGLVIASHGLVTIYEWIASKRNDLSYYPSIIFGSFLIALSIGNLGVRDYGKTVNSIPGYRQIFGSASLACGSEPYPAYPITISETSDFDSAMRVVHFLMDQKPTGRVASETAGTDNLRIGSPHFFSTLLPLSGRIEVIPGLLVESSYSSQFFTSTLGYLSYAIRWGRDYISAYFHKENQDVDINSMINRLRMWGAEYLIASSKGYKQALAKADDKLVSLAYGPHPFAVYRLEKPAPKVGALSYKPYLFVDLGGMDFRSFSEQWYISDEMLSSPVIFTKKQFDQLSEYEQQAIGGFILSLPGKFNQPESTIGPWLNHGKPVVIIGDAGIRKGHYERWIADGNEFSPSFTKNGSPSRLLSGAMALHFLYRLLPDYIRTAKVPVGTNNPIKATIDNGKSIDFDHHGGAIINYSYFPRWKSRDPEQTVFLATPSVMYVVSRGKTELYYD